MAQSSFEKKSSSGKSLRWIALCGALAAGLVAAAQAQQTSMVETRGDGLASYRFTNRAGAVTVNLPDDIRMGDTISGTVLVEPAGRNEAERQRNSDTLSGYVIEARTVEGEVVDIKTVEGEVVATQAPPNSRGRRFLYAVPAAVGVSGLLLRDRSGRTLSRTGFPVGSQVTSPGPADLPVLAQAGRPITINGNFDGDASNTQASIGGSPAPIIAESPRTAVVQAPPQPLGPSAITVNENGTQSRGELRNLRVALSAPKTSLVRGETTMVSVQVSGLEGIKSPVPLSLVATGAIQMEGGNVQSIAMAPGQTGTQGIYQAARQIQAREAGTFLVTGSVLGTGAIKDDPLFPGAIDMNGINGAKQLLGLLASMNDEERERRIRATLDALHRRIAGASGGTKDWLNEKLKIVQSVADTLGIK